MSMILTVHGYNTDPYSDRFKDRPTEQQCAFAKALGPFSTMPFNWYSSVQVKDFIRCLRAGHLNTYAWAYKKLALQATDDFVKVVKSAKYPVDVFAHSLGSRVVLQALQQVPERFNRICFINAAERSSVAKGIIRTAFVRGSNVDILNVCVQNDDILDKAAGYASPGLFTKEEILGQDGIGTRIIVPGDRGSYREIFIDDPLTQYEMKKKYGLDLRGDNPDDYGDHHFSYRHSGNWGLYSLFFNGDLSF